MDAYRARPPYQQNDYIGWISRAKKDETKQKRLAQMLENLLGSEATGITETEAYQLCSLAADFAVTQSVNQEKGVHGRLRKVILDRG